MAMSQSFRDIGSDEANDDVYDICSYCATSEKLQPATHFCIECGPCGRYMCGICLKNHNLFLSGHKAIYIKSQTDIDSYRNQRKPNDQNKAQELKKKNDQLETLLKQETEALEKQRKYVRKLESDVKKLETQIQDMFERGNKQMKETEKALDEAKTTIFEYENKMVQMYADIDNQERRYRDIVYVAAIDIGSSHSGCALSSTVDYKADQCKMSIIPKWFAGSACLMSLKAPTVVLFDAKERFHSFGYDAENTYADLADADEHHKWYFFNHIKMTLFKEIHVTQSLEIEDVHGKKMKAIDVFGAVIKYLKDRLLSYVKKRKPEISNEDILWVFTVPATWNACSTLFLREAVYKADIDNRHLSMVTEPEAASLYCEMLPAHKIWGSGDARTFIQRAGTKYMVIDLGDKADFTVFEKQINGDIKVLHNDSGCVPGGRNIDEEFYKLLIRIIGSRVYQKSIDENKEDHLDLQRELETKKRTISPNSSGKITIKVPVRIMKTYEDEMKESTKEAIKRSPFNGKITLDGYRMRIEAQIFKNLLKPCTDKIVAHVKDLLKQPDVQGTNIFLMVGGFSESVILQDAIVKALPNGKVIIPEEAELAVMKGAVMYGHRRLSAF